MSDDFVRRHVGLSDEERARLEKPLAEERARRRWGVHTTKIDLTE